MISILAASLVLIGGQGHSINDLVQPDFQDASFQVKLLYADQSELGKINKDFGTTYRFKTLEVKLKEPFMLRASGKAEDTEFVFIQNGARRVTSVPRIGYNHRENLDDEPGKRQTPLDFGFMTSSMFKDLLVATWVRDDRATGDHVYDITYNPRYNYKSHFRIWVDPTKHYITKREWYRKDRQLATFYYTEPVNEGGVWLPTHMVVKNVNDVRSGETQYIAIKINSGLSDDLFKLK
jgi:outer membrane lipoprotein-sorting protein